MNKVDIVAFVAFVAGVCLSYYISIGELTKTMHAIENKMSTLSCMSELSCVPYWHTIPTKESVNNVFLCVPPKGNKNGK